MRALSIDDDQLAERLLQEYFGQDLAKVKEVYRERGMFISGAVVHKINPQTVQELEQTNFFVKDYQINRLTFRPI